MITLQLDKGEFEFIGKLVREHCEIERQDYKILRNGRSLLERLMNVNGFLVVNPDIAKYFIRLVRQVCLNSEDWDHIVKRMNLLDKLEEQSNFDAEIV